MLVTLLQIAFGAMVMMFCHELWHILVARLLGYSSKLQIRWPHITLDFSPDFKCWRDAVLICGAGFGINIAVAAILLLFRYWWSDIWPVWFVWSFTISQAGQFLLYPFLIETDTYSDFYYLCPQYKSRWQAKSR